MQPGRHQGEAWHAKLVYKGQAREAALRGLAHLFAALNRACLVLIFRSLVMFCRDKTGLFCR